jgi:hypothetical protein
MTDVAVSKSAINHDVSSGQGSKKIETRTMARSSVGTPVPIVVPAPLGAIVVGSWIFGWILGMPVKTGVGTAVATVDSELGERLGLSLSTTVDGVGLSDCLLDGATVGTTDGATVGTAVGATVGAGPNGCVVVGLLGASVGPDDTCDGVMTGGVEFVVDDGEGVERSVIPTSSNADGRTQ